MKYLNKYVYVIGSAILLLSFFVGNALATSVQPCPPGSYMIDYGICKQEPTGCPYGDSIPVDSPKCVPPTTTDKTDNVGSTSTEEPVNVNTESWGK